MQPPRLALVALMATSALLAAATSADGQTIYTWNNTGTNFSSAGSWNPAGGPSGSADIVQFTPTGSPFPATITQPTIDADRTTGAFILAPTPLFGGWTFSGSSTLTINFPGMNVYGPATYTFDGPSIQGPPATNQLLNITNGSTVVLQGNSTVPANAGTIFLHGGTLVLDNSTNNASSRLPLFTSSFNVQNGTLELRGNTSAATNFSLGPLTTNGGTFTGTNTIRLVPGGGGPLAVNFNNTGANFTTLFSSSAIFRAEATSGVLGGPGANDPRLTFTGSPALGANGLLASSTGRVGFVIVSDANGTDFATWTAADGMKAAGATLTSSNAIGTGSISSGTANDRVFYTPGSGTQTASTDITNGSLRITPSATGGVLAMGTKNLQTIALMLDGNKDFTISGTGTLASGLSPRYIHVNDPNTTLTTSLVITSGTSQPTAIVGPGFVVLNGSASQNTGSGATRLLGGTLRANNVQFGFSGTGSGNLTFAGGVLEIQNGNTFSRPLGAAAGMVQWTGGNGGFSAFGSNASVNLGGGSAKVTWGSGGFVGDGYALTFGSTKSNALLTWLNPIDLGAPSNGSYVLREIHVTKGVGGLTDFTRIARAITGDTNADLLKTGNGVLELFAINTHKGNTLIQAGTLIVSGQLGEVSATKTGNVVVGAGALLAGAGFVYPNQSIPLDPKSVIVNPGSAIRGGNPVGATAADHTASLTVSSAVTINSNSAANGSLQFEPHRTGVGTASTSKLVLDVGYTLNFNPGAGNRFTLELVASSITTPLDLNQPYTLTLASVGATGHIQLNGVNLTDGTTIDRSNYILTSSSFAFDPNYSLQVLGSDATGYDLSLTATLTPVPEPTVVLGLAAGALVVGALGRRLRYNRG